MKLNGTRLSARKSPWRILFTAALGMSLAACSAYNPHDPFSQGKNPSVQNPARLSQDRIDELIKDVSTVYNQISSDGKAGNVSYLVQEAIALVKANPSLIKDPTTRATFLAMKPFTVAISSCTLEVYYLLLKYSGAENLPSFPEYYVDAVNRGYVTGDGTRILDYVKDPGGIIAGYGRNKYKFELVTFAAKNEKTAELKKKFLSFTYSGAALGHFRVSHHSIIGYWDDTKLRRADTYHLEYERQVMNGQVVADGSYVRPVHYIQILRLKNAPSMPTDRVLPDNQKSWMQKIRTYLNNLLEPYGLSNLPLPLAIGAILLLALMGRSRLEALRKELMKLPGPWGKDAAGLIDAAEKVDSLKDKFSNFFHRITGGGSADDALEAAANLVLSNDYTEALQVLRPHDASGNKNIVKQLLELYTFLNDEGEFQKLLGKRQGLLDSLDHGAFTNYLKILWSYQKSDYDNMQKLIDDFQSAGGVINWDLRFVRNFLDLRPDSQQKGDLMGFIEGLMGGSK